MPARAGVGPFLRRPSLRRSMMLGFAWAALAVAMLSGWFVVTRFSVTRELRIWDITALRFGIGAILLAPAVLRRGRWLALAAWPEGLLFMLLWGVPFVLLVALFARAFLREEQGRTRWLGYGAIVAGLVCLVTAGAAAHGAPSPAGLCALALAAAMWAVYTLLFRRSGLTPIEAAALICIWSALLFIPAYLLLGLSRLGPASTGEIALQAGYQGVLMSGVAIVAFNRAVSLLGAAAATAIIALMPAVASILAIPVLGEAPTPIESIATAIIVIGVLLAAAPAPARRLSPIPES